MFNNYWGTTESPSLDFINFLVSVAQGDEDFLDYIYGEGQ